MGKKYWNILMYLVFVLILFLYIWFNLDKPKENKDENEHIRVANEFIYKIGNLGTLEDITIANYKHNESFYQDKRMESCNLAKEYLHSEFKDKFDCDKLPKITEFSEYSNCLVVSNVHSIDILNTSLYNKNEIGLKISVYMNVSIANRMGNDEGSDFSLSVKSNSTPFKIGDVWIKLRKENDEWKVYDISRLNNSLRQFSGLWNQDGATIYIDDYLDVESFVEDERKNNE